MRTNNIELCQQLPTTTNLVDKEPTMCHNVYVRWNWIESPEYTPSDMGGVKVATLALRLLRRLKEYGR